MEEKFIITVSRMNRLLLILLLISLLPLSVFAEDLYPGVLYLLQDASGNDILRITSSTFAASSTNLNIASSSGIFQTSELQSNNINAKSGTQIQLGNFGIGAGNIVIQGDLIPQADDSYLLGSASKRWNSLRVSGQITTNALVGSTANIGGVSVGVLRASDGTEVFNINNSLSLTPVSDNNTDLGTTTKRWRDGLFGGTVSSTQLRSPSSTIGTLTVSGITSAFLVADSVGLISGKTSQACGGTDKVSSLSASGTIICSADETGAGAQGTVTTSSQVFGNYVAVWNANDGTALRGSSTIFVSGSSLLTGGTFNASGTISVNGVAVLTTSTGLGVSNFASANISQWTNDSNYVVNTRTINTTAPLSGGGNLSADRTLSISLDSATLATVSNNLTVRLNSSSTQSCSGTNKVSSITSNGIVTCTTDETGSGGSPTSTYEMVVTASASNSSDKGIEAVCPAGKIVMGGGGNLSNNAVNLSDSHPSGTTSWWAFGNEEGSISGNWTITAYAICL